MNISICGINCAACELLGSYCQGGCNKLHGKPPHFTENGFDGCPLYNCCSSKQHQHCGKCADFPCQKYYELRDPRQSEAAHEEGIKQRVACLRKLK